MAASSPPERGNSVEYVARKLTKIYVNIRFVNGGVRNGRLAFCHPNNDSLADKAVGRRSIPMVTCVHRICIVPLRIIVARLNGV